MDLLTKKYQLIEWITNISDSHLIDKLMKIAETTDWWNEISVAERKSIEKGLKDIEESRVFDHSEVREKYEKYI
jgi:predicted transcriptional regulator